MGGKPYSTTGQVLNQAIAQLAADAGWNLADPGQKAVQDLTYTALQGMGSLAAPITVAYVPGGTAGAEVVTVAGSAITVQIASGTSTASQILAKVNASTAATALVSAAVTGTGSNPQTATTYPQLVTGDVCQRIAEGDNEIDTRLAGLEVPLPFATNPPALADLSVLYARFACLRDLYSGNSPHAVSPAAQAFKDRFEEKWMHLEEGWAKLVDGSGNTVAAGKFKPQSTPEPALATTSLAGVDTYPSYPLGPYPDPPGVDNQP